MNPVRWSNLKYMADCPAMYKHVLDNGVTVTPAMRFGSLVHGLVLGFQYDAPVVWDGDRRGKVWTDFKELHEGKEIVTKDEWDRAAECAAAITSDPVCGPLVASGIKEHRLTWEIAGRECAGTPDINGSILLDLKVTQMVNPYRFAYHARKMLWHSQVAWYKNGVEATGGHIDEAYLLAVPPKEPFLPTAYRLIDETLDYGKKQWRLLFEQLRACEESGVYPGYSQSILPLDITENELALSIGGEDFDL